MRWRDYSVKASETVPPKTKASNPQAILSPAKNEIGTPASTSSSLPSHTENRRSNASKQLNKILDNLLVQASVASQYVNAYTGTDYSGIEALRKEIIDLEDKVKVYHAAVDLAKSSHSEALAKQTAAQREIVGLLERKSSWSPSDLERYMSLVRSEHLNDQDVQAAKDNLGTAERKLEDTRSLLEKLERKQYHEEQIWSDTIRRNSTWVTFGLMGVNILLLLANIAIFEPYRRRKIVRDVKGALDEKTLHANPVAADAEKQIDATVPPTNVIPEQAAKDVEQPLDAILPAEGKDVGRALLAAGESLPGEAADFTGAGPTVNEKQPEPLELPNSQAAIGSLETYQEAFQDLFSERIVQLRKVDVTNAALQGAATGVAIMGLLFVLLRPK